MITIYNPRNWPSVQLLVNAFREVGVESESREFVIPGSPIINWGYTSGQDALNNRIIGNKLKELEKLQEAGVHTVTVSTEPRYGAQWLARALKHSGGRDLVRGVRPSRRAYWTKREDVENEFRVHIIGGKCVKVGRKVKKDDSAHPWVRSLRYGWRPSYSAEVRELVSPALRSVCKRAVSALGYDFAAVDVGVKEDGTPVVFEVNTAPGLKTSIAKVYAKHLKELLP